VEEVVGALDGAGLDRDALLQRQACNELLDIGLRHDLVLLRADDQAGRRAGGEEGEVVGVCRRRHRNEAVDLGAPHQQLHADPGAERVAGDPARLGVGIHALQPVERCSGVGQFPHAVVEASLTAADTPGVEPQHRETAIHENMEQREHDLVVHRPAILRVRMQDQRDRCALSLALVIATFEATLGAGEHHVRHRDSGSSPCSTLWS